MNAPLQKATPHKNSSIEKNGQRKNNKGGTAQFVDNRPEVIVQRKLQTMMNKAASDHFDPTTTPTVLQAMFVKKEPINRQIYAVSDADDIVTGMGTPNHELYVEKPKQISDINKMAAKSKMNFKSAGKVKLFSKDYYKVRAGFKENEKVKAAEVPKKPTLLDRIHGRDKVKEHQVNLDQSYHQRVAPEVAKHSKIKRDAMLKQIKQKPWAKNFQELQPVIKKLNSQLELVKKLLINNQATEDYHDVMNEMEPAYGFVAAVESILFGESVTRFDFVNAKKLIGKYYSRLETLRNSDKLLDEAIGDTFRYIAEAQSSMPKDLSVNMLMIHSVNYEESMIESVKVGDPMFYRACDVMASTLMGNEMTKENEQQIKTYGAGGSSGAFHYAAKILESGNDWVTLESFAAGTREQKIIGQTEENSLRNLDNSWNYMMYGSVKKKDSANSQQDNYFELYTKLRYYLKGIKEPGAFRTTARERLTSRIREDALKDIVGSTKKSKEIFTRLVFNKVLDSSGKVVNPEYLKESYIKPRLEEEDQKHSKAICEKLMSQYNKASYAHPYVQASANNEVRNILGWITNIGLPIDTDRFDAEFGNRLAMQEENAKSIHDAAWESLMISMLQNK